MDATVVHDFGDVNLRAAGAGTNIDSTGWSFDCEGEYLCDGFVLGGGGC